MNWDDLRVFLTVARAESLSRAGALLKMDPATVGRRVARLEDAFGAVLFAKSPQGYALTDAGQRLMEHTARAEQSIAQGVDDVTGDTGQLSGAIRIGAPDGAANFLLPQVCAAINRDNPGLEVQIVALPRVFNLSKREADMALTVSPPVAGRLLVQKISDYKLHLGAAESYLDNAPAITTLTDVQNHPVIGYIPDMIFDKELDYLSELKVEHLHISSNSVSVQINAIREGAGVGIVHDFAVPFMDGVTRILTDQLSLSRAFYLVRHADDRKVERLNRFAGLLAQGIRAEVSRLEAIA